MRQGAWMILAIVPMLMVVGALSAMDDDFAVLAIVPLLCFLIGLARLLYGLFLVDRKGASKSEALPSSTSAARLVGAERVNELPPLRTPADRMTPQRTQTAEMVAPSSVTENTTRLLDEETGAQQR